MRVLQQVVYQELPQDLRPYWSYRDEICISDGVLFKGRQVIIPEAPRQYFLVQLLEAHIGIEKTRRLMRDSVYWPNIHKDIEILIKSCETCQESQTEQKKQSMLAHDVPSTPWTKVASDMFEINGDHYLLINDYLSKFPYVKKVQSTSSATTAHLTAECFGLFGPPTEMSTDNGHNM